MKLAGILASVYLVPFVVAILILNNAYNPLSSILYDHIRFSSSSLPMHLLFNTIVFSIIIVSYKPYTKEVDQDLSRLYYSHEVGEYALDYINGSSDKEMNYEESHGSDGYEDDDDDGDDEDDDDDDVDDDDDDNDVGQEDKGYDDNLQKRVEDFIDKVVNGWKEEKMQDRSTRLNQ